MSIEITFLYCHSIENVTLAEPPQRQRGVSMITESLLCGVVGVIHALIWVFKHMIPDLQRLLAWGCVLRKHG